MKITVSYISSVYDLPTTLKKIEETSADAIHLDLMDGKYVPTLNFDINTLKENFKNCHKKLDVHLMVKDPYIYLEELYKMNTNIIFFHPKTASDVNLVIENIHNNKRLAGIVINPDEDTKDYLYLLPLVDAVLIMSVNPGKGGQAFMRSSLTNYELIKFEKKHWHFLLYVDGGINDETINYVKEADGVIVGSFICNSTDFEEQINKLRNTN